MGALAEVYGLDAEKARLIGLLHDAGKDLDPEQQAQFLATGDIKIYYECEKNYNFFLHGPVGAALVQERLGIGDDLILEAITNHTYYGNGKSFDHPMCWCLRFADILEPYRDFRAVKWLNKGLDRLRKVVYAGRMAEGVYLQTGWMLQWFQEDGLPIHPNLVKSHQRFAKKMNAAPMFQEPVENDTQAEEK